MRFAVLVLAAMLLAQCSARPAAAPAPPGAYLYASTTGANVTVYDVDRQRAIGELHGIDGTKFSELLDLHTTGDTVYAWERGNDVQSGGTVDVYRAGELDAAAHWRVKQPALLMIADISEGIIYFASWTGLQAYSAAGDALWQLNGRRFLAADRTGRSVYVAAQNGIVEHYQFDGHGLRLLASQGVADLEALRLPDAVESLTSTFENEIRVAGRGARVVYPACGVGTLSWSDHPSQLIHFQLPTDRRGVTASAGPRGTVDLVTAKCSRFAEWRLERYRTDGTRVRVFSLPDGESGFRLAYAP